jgi:hypothetical protein
MRIAVGPPFLSQLAAGKGPIDTLVIDSVSRPSEN